MLARGPLQCIEVRQGEISHASYISRRLGYRLVKPSHESLKVSLRRCHVDPQVLDKGTPSGLAAAAIPGTRHSHALDAVVRQS